MIGGIRVQATALFVGDQNSQRGGIAYRPKAGFTDCQRIQCHLAGDDVTQGSREPVGVDVALGEIVIRPSLHSLPSQFFIGQAAQHQDEEIWRSEVDLIERLDTLNVGQRQIEHDDVNAFLAQSFKTGGEQRNPLDSVRAVYFRGERLQNQFRVGGIVLDEKYQGGLVVHRSPTQMRKLGT